MVDGLTGQVAVEVAEEFDGKIGISGVVLTRMDGDGRGGAALSMRAVTGKPIKYVGLGEKLDALETFEAGPDRRSHPRHGRTSWPLWKKLRKPSRPNRPKRMMKRFQKGRFNMNDMKMQLEQMQKMGGMEGMSWACCRAWAKWPNRCRMLGFDDRMIVKQPDCHDPIHDQEWSALTRKSFRPVAQKTHRQRLRHGGL